MLGRLLLLLMILPFLELFLMVRVHRFWTTLWGNTNAWFMTIGTIFMAAIIGVALARKQGFRLIAQAQEQMKQGSMPSRTMLEGLLMLMGAAALLVPGYLTDFFGILLLMRWIRSILVKRLGLWLGRQVQNGHITVYQTGHHSQHGSLIQESGSADIIDVEPIHKS